MGGCVGGVCGGVVWGGVCGGGRIFGGIAWFSGEIEWGGVGFEGFWGDHMVLGGTEGDQSSLTTGKRVTIES